MANAYMSFLGTSGYVECAVILNHAKVPKKVRIAGIYYGAFEVPGNAFEARRKSIEVQTAAVLDLASLDLLLEWTRLRASRKCGTEVRPGCACVRTSRRKEPGRIAPAVENGSYRAREPKCSRIPGIWPSIR